MRRALSPSASLPVLSDWLNFVYTSYVERKMSTIEKCDQDQFATGQSSSDLRAGSEGMEPETERDVEATEQRPGIGPEEFPAPIGKLLGLKLLQAENGMAMVEFVADERHANPMGTLTGGVLCEITDAAMGFAYYTTRGR
jgi:hypothetical protein